jgi:hypothetical protein
VPIAHPATAQHVALKLARISSLTIPLWRWSNGWPSGSTTIGVISGSRQGARRRARSLTPRSKAAPVTEWIVASLRATGVV